MTVIACLMILYVIFVALVIAWLWAEIRADRKWRASIDPTVPGPRERMPPESDV